MFGYAAFAQSSFASLGIDVYTSWFIIDNNQTVTWYDINNNQSVAWQNIGNDQTTNWAVTNNTQE
jgi:hypothetical protein